MSIAKEYKLSKFEIRKNKYEIEKKRKKRMN